jgi:hypothetical protein
MVKFFIAIILNGFSCLTFANFTSVDNIDHLNLPTNFEKVKYAAVSLGDCGGTYIGSNGYILTALHCLRTRVQEHITIKEFKTDLVRTNLEELRTKPSTNFHIGINAQLPTMEFPTQYKIIAAGKGYYTGIDFLQAAIKNSDFFSKLQEDGYGSTQDWAIIKIEEKNTPCVNIENPGLREKEKVWSLSYQAREGYETWKSHKSKQYYSEGIITSGITDNSAFQKWLQKFSVDKRELLVNFYKSTLELPGALFTTVDAVPGVSGSGLFDKDGNVVGVLNAVEWFGLNGQEVYLPGTTQAVSTSSIVEALKQHFSDNEIKEMFFCSNE